MTGADGSAPAGEGARPTGRHFRAAGEADAAGAVGIGGAADADGAVGTAVTADAAADSSPEPQDADVAGTASVPHDDAGTREGKVSDTGTADAASDGTDAAPKDLPALPELEDDPHAGLTRVRKKTHNRLKRRLRIAAIVVAVLAVLVGGTVAVVFSLMNQGGQALRDASEAKDLDVADDASSKDKGKTVTYNGKTYRYNENIVSIVVIGTDLGWSTTGEGQAGQADAIMVVALDTETGDMKAIGVPRETMVDVDENVGSSFVGQDTMQLSLAYSYGDGYASSSENVVRAVSRILYNMPMNYYFTIQMDGVSVLNDAVGGVTLTPLESIPGTSIREGKTLTLYGSNAQRYVQYRDTSYLESSSDRQARQVQYLKAFFTQAIATAKGNPVSLIELYRAVQDYSTTNLGISEFTFLASKLVNSGLSDLNITTLSGTQQKGAQFVEFYPDEASTYQTVLDTFYTPVDDAE